MIAQIFRRLGWAALFAGGLLSLPQAGLSQSSCSRVAVALQTASRIRGLPILRDVACLELSKHGFQDLVREKTLKDAPTERVNAEEKVLKMLGLIPFEYDYQRCVIRDYGADVLAFYQPERDTIIFPNWNITPQDILVHEAVHALQDQHFDLEKLRDDAIAEGDRLMALSALAEGDAMTVQYKYLKEVEGNNRVDEVEAPVQSDSCGLPELLRELFDFPYDYGPLFINKLKERGGDNSIEQAFRNPPRTTREILYPRLYPAPKISMKISGAWVRSSFPRTSFRSVHEDILGEYVLRAFLRAKVSPQRGVLAAKGWIADRVALFQSHGSEKNLLKWESRWESAKEAEEFRRAFVVAISTAFSLHLNELSPRIIFGSTRLPFMMIEQNGSQVRYIASELLPDRVH